jgi:hypothetical protein
MKDGSKVDHMLYAGSNLDKAQVVRRPKSHIRCGGLAWCPPISGRMLSGSQRASALLDYRREVVTEQHVEWRVLISSGDPQTCQQ